MYKQRDNEFHPPMTVDPSGTGTGGGVTALASPFGDAAGSPGLDGPAVAAGSRKRGRDIRGIHRFRTVVYGDDGFRRLHAMVARNPALMYPPDGIDAARARVAARRAERASVAAVASAANGQPEEDDVFALFEARHRAEAAATRDEEAEAEPQPPTSSLAALRHDEELATYHHTQLDTYLRQLYEFNHVTFVKLPMEDTLQLLSRCGKEALAHVMEFETQLRLQRQSRIRDMVELREEQAELEERRRAMEAEEQARLLADAEQRQAELELELELAHSSAAVSGMTESLPLPVVKPETRDEDNEDEQKVILMDSNNAAVAAEQPPRGPSVHFAEFPQLN